MRFGGSLVAALAVLCAPAYAVGATTHNAVTPARISATLTPDGAAVLSSKITDISATPADLSPKPAEVLASLTTAKVPSPFRSGSVPFSIRFDGIESSLGTLPAFVLPGATFEFSAKGGSGRFEAKSESGPVASTGDASWRWTAPAENGVHEIQVRDLAGKPDDAARLQVFVMKPYDGSGFLGSYRIGDYQAPKKDGNTAYQRPAGFIEVTEANLDTPVSPHFRLGQFICKEEGGFPKYVALRTALLVKLEALLAALADRGLPADTLHVMSGYRTPAYNAGIGNETTYSRHTYGDAADVFLDRDGDGKLDDLDHDGQITREDARVMFDLAESALDGALDARLAGGLSAYAPTPSHGPFLHIDARGTRARW